jgi:predicted AAA+ superfamily ATPase
MRRRKGKMTIKRDMLGVLREKILGKRLFIQVLAGPRQTGKTTLVRQLEEENLLYTRFYSADGLAAEGPEWIERIWDAFRLELKRQKKTQGLLIIDEIQKINGWSETVKKNWDADTRTDTRIKLVILGSSRILLQEGLSESLLGRFELHYLGHWSFAEMSAAFGLSADQYVWFGAYPGAASFFRKETEFKNYILNSIIEPCISRDILLLTKVSKPALLHQLFELGASYSAQILSFNKILGTMRDAGNTTTLSRYLQLLDQAGLLAGLQKYTPSPSASKASIPKFQLHNNALFSALRTENFDEGRKNSILWGRAVESAAGSWLVNQARGKPNWALYYWREKNDEVDYILKRGEKLLAIEIKSGLRQEEARNLSVFKKHFPNAKTLLVGPGGMDLAEFLQLPVEDF